jgi:DNA-binding Lrp family transcriptional regulator
MVQAYILIQTEVGKARDVAAAIRDLAGVLRVDPVTGPYDVIVLAEARNIDEFVNRIHLVPGITRQVICSVIHV